MAEVHSKLDNIETGLLYCRDSFKYLCILEIWGKF